MSLTQIMDNVLDLDALTIVAKQRRPRVKRWCGVRGGGTRKQMVCYICDAQIATWEANYRMPAATIDKVLAHRDEHESEMVVQARRDLDIPVCPQCERPYSRSPLAMRYGLPLPRVGQPCLDCQSLTNS